LDTLLIYASVGSLAVAGLSASGRPVRQGPTDDQQLWVRICGQGDVLMGASFRDAVRSEPLLVESLVMQRVGRPFLLLCTRIVRPWVGIDVLDAQIWSAWIGRNRGLRAGSGSVHISELSRSVASSWRQNSRILVDAMSVDTLETERVRQAMRSRRADIRRAFDECRQIYDTAAALDPENAHYWLVLRSVIDDMEAVVGFLSDGAVLVGEADIRSDLGLAVADRFGAVSVDAEGYGQWLHEEYILSGHRAPSVGLPQYRRMGGRVFG